MSSMFLAAASGNLDVWHLVLQSGPVSKFVLICLLLFSMVSWGIIAERYRTLRKADRENESFLARFHKGGGLASTQDDTRNLQWSPVAEVFRAGFREISLNPPPPGSDLSGASLDAFTRMLRKSAGVQMAELERTLGFLATTASATPFIGLFGTVWGIMNAFRGIGVSGTASLAAYAPGIAEALVATAAGLAAAIPAVIGYNYLLGRLNVTEAHIEEFIADFTHRVQGRKG